MMNALRGFPVQWSAAWARTRGPSCSHTVEAGTRRWLPGLLQSRRPLHGFTLVELLVVIAIIGVLVALLLPAVQAAREAARRSQCGNNFRQAGLALHNYHDAVRKFPPGTIMWMHGLGPNCGAPGSAGDYYGFGWSTLILPYLEENTIYDQFDFKLQMSGEFNVNFVTGGKRIETYLCPSDPNGGGLADFSSGGQNGVDPREDLRATNMAAVSDSTDWTCDTNQLWPKELRKANGTFGERDGCRMKQITDGTSKTLLVGEVTGDIPTNYSSFVWASFNLADTLDGINGPFSLPGGVYASNGPGGILGFRKSGFSSWHPGGCHFVLADGSVRFIADSISAHLLSAYTTRAGGEASNDELP